MRATTKVLKLDRQSAMARKSLMEMPEVTEPIRCAVTWQPSDVGSVLSIEEIIRDWKTNFVRPCGLRHSVIDKRWCKYRCDKAINDNAACE